jgi:hypothetical protein
MYAGRYYEKVYLTTDGRSHSHSTFESSGLEKINNREFEDCILRIAISRVIFNNTFMDCGLSIAIYL